MAVAPWIVSDESWELVEPLMPVKERRLRYPGRKRLPDRQALQGILFVLHTGISWTHLPVELGFAANAAARHVATAASAHAAAIARFTPGSLGPGYDGQGGFGAKASVPPAALLARWQRPRSRQ